MKPEDFKPWVDYLMNSDLCYSSVDEIVAKAPRKKRPAVTVALEIALAMMGNGNDSALCAFDDIEGGDNLCSKCLLLKYYDEYCDVLLGRKKDKPDDKDIGLLIDLYKRVHGDMPKGR